MKLQILVLLTVIAGSSATVWPRHVAATDGSNATFQCNPTNSGTGGMWTFRPYNSASNTFTTIYKSSSSLIGDAYDSDPNKPHDLIIRTLGEATAGDYMCFIDDQTESQVAATMVVKDLTCSIHQSGDAPNSPVTFECRVSVYGRIDPDMEWIRNDQVQSGDPFRVEEPVDNWSWRTLQLDYETTTSTEYDNEVHTCRVFWAPNAEDNLPTYETECTEVYRVRHSPTNMQIHHEGVMVTPSQTFPAMVGDNITCSVSAYPEAVITWEHVGGNGPADPLTESDSENTLQLIVTDDMIGEMSEYNCLAEGNSETVQETITFSVVAEDGSVSSASLVQFTFSTLVAMLVVSYMG